mmetsp:Transcript_12175/g.18201  ORF Transcript_12175/g.18201 Transcript_12175/m.18201 type:complete len:101 (+) Transcript_12175:409-711(+)
MEPLSPIEDRQVKQKRPKLWEPNGILQFSVEFFLVTRKEKQCASSEPSMMFESNISSGEEAEFMFLLFTMGLEMNALSSLIKMPCFAKVMSIFVALMTLT